MTARCAWGLSGLAWVKAHIAGYEAIQLPRGRIVRY